jgi:CheY-like chemotaxis protein
MNSWEYTIMMVEDERDEVFLLKRAFHRAGVRNPILVFRDGQEAIEHLDPRGNSVGRPLSGAPPALMLLNLKTPRKTGFEVLEWLRRQPRLKRLVVVVMSDSFQQDDINRAYELGCNSCLLKPGSEEEWAEKARLIGNYWLTLNEKPELCEAPSPFRSV